MKPSEKNPISCRVLFVFCVLVVCATYLTGLLLRRHELKNLGSAMIKHDRVTGKSWMLWSGKWKPLGEEIPEGKFDPDAFLKSP